MSIRGGIITILYKLTNLIMDQEWKRYGLSEDDWDFLDDESKDEYRATYGYVSEKDEDFDDLDK